MRKKFKEKIEKRVNLVVIVLRHGTLVRTLTEDKNITEYHYNKDKKAEVATKVQK